MTHAQFWKRLERLEQPRQSIKIVGVILIGEGEPEPPHNPNVEVMQLFPGAELRRKKDHGRAEALLLALYGQRASGVRDLPVPALLQPVWPGR